MSTAIGQGRRLGPGSARAWVVALLMAVVGAVGLLLLTGTTASAHVVPTSSVQLDVRAADEIQAVTAIPVTDLESATGLDLGEGTQAAVDANAAAINAYLLAHFAPTSDSGQPWAVTLGALTATTTGDPATTGRYQQLQTTVTLTPPAGTDVRSFDLGYTAIVDHVATHVVIVTVSSDWAGGTVDGTYQAGVVSRDTVTNTVQPLHIDLGAGSNARGFASMVALGMHHIEEGTDHQLFLLTLLLPAPLLVRVRRWAGPVPARQAIRRIAAITASFTLGHSVTLALGAVGLPVPQGVVEALIAVSILVAAAHAIRPLFPGREALIAGAFGLIHGLAFSTTLRELHLDGAQLVLSLLGFNLGIEAMQLAVVALVLPPLVLLARSGRYKTLRTTASVATAVAAIGWLAARLGLANPIAEGADQLEVIAIWVVAGLWVVAVASLARVPTKNSGSATPVRDRTGGAGVSDALALRIRTRPGKTRHASF